ncbi:hypothetical protein BOO36_19415, partial [Vibrio navarrensis]|uniref:hypothetical protein n=1 Tax=Vibrio navarrensis TaxID=29495 RepID=UPI001D04E174
TFGKLKAKAKLPTRLCTKLANLTQAQNSIEATSQDLRWQTMLICRKPERIVKGRKKKPQTTDF